MSEDNLKWKIASLFKGIEPADAYREVERIKQEHDGEITAKILLEASRPQESVFHKYFNWNDADAAEKYRLRQAGDLLRNIQVHIIADGGSKNIRVYEVVKTEQGAGVYKDIESMAPDDVEYIRTQTIRAISNYKNKLLTYDIFSEVVKHLDDAIEELESVGQSKIAV